MKTRQMGHIYILRKRNQKSGQQIYKDTDIRIAYTTTNTIQKKHAQVKQRSNNQYDGSGIYSLNCRDCPLIYISQTGLSFKTRFKDNIRAIKYNKDARLYTAHKKHETHIRKYSGQNGCNTCK
jgi:hypothetical protein